MSYVLIDEKLENMELIAYELSKLVIKEGYYSEVKGTKDNASIYIYKDRFFKNAIGTPTIIKVTYTKEENDICVEVNYATVNFDKDNIIKETLGVLLVLPTITKSIQYINMKKRIKILAIKAINNLKKG